MSFSTRLVVQRDLVRDVGQIVEDVLGKPRDVSLVPTVAQPCSLMSFHTPACVLGWRLAE
jgi:hypothetical protein